MHSVALYGDENVVLSAPFGKLVKRKAWLRESMVSIRGCLVSVGAESETFIFKLAVVFQGLSMK